MSRRSVPAATVRPDPLRLPRPREERSSRRLRRARRERVRTAVAIRPAKSCGYRHPLRNARGRYALLILPITVGGVGFPQTRYLRERPEPRWRIVGQRGGARMVGISGVTRRIAAAVVLGALAAPFFGTAPRSPARPEHRVPTWRPSVLRQTPGTAQCLALLRTDIAARPASAVSALDATVGIRSCRPPERLRASVRERGRRADGRGGRRIRPADGGVRPRRSTEASSACPRARPPTAASARWTRTAAPAIRLPTRTGESRSPWISRWSPPYAPTATSCSSRPTAPTTPTWERRSIPPCRWARSPCRTAMAVPSGAARPPTTRTTTTRAWRSPPPPVTVATTARESRAATSTASSTRPPRHMWSRSAARA